MQYNFKHFTKKWVHDFLVRRISSPLSRMYKPRYTNLSDVDWDLLIVFDACRADLFESAVNIDYFDSYRRISSVGTSTQEWASRTWSEDQTDVVYTTATPAPMNHAQGLFRRTDNVWSRPKKTDTELTNPDQLTQQAIHNLNDLSDSRHVIHYIQPHIPLRFCNFQIDLPNSKYSSLGYHEFDLLREGKINESEFFEGYLKNLLYGLNSAIKVITEYEGKIIITSDHGNGLGEKYWFAPWGIYGHPHDVWIKELYEVPFGVISGPETVETLETDVQQLLNNLGYY